MLEINRDYDARGLTNKIWKSSSIVEILFATREGVLNALRVPYIVMVQLIAIKQWHVLDVIDRVISNLFFQLNSFQMALSYTNALT